MSKNNVIDYREAALKLLNIEDNRNDSKATNPIKQIAPTNNVHYINSCTSSRRCETPSTTRNFENPHIDHELHSQDNSRQTSNPINNATTHQVQQFQVIKNGSEDDELTARHLTATDARKAKEREDEKLVRKINSILFKLGMTPGKKGYKYTRTAVKISLDNPESLDYITKDIYPAVAKIHGSTYARVERNIRSSISDISPDNGFRKEVFPGGKDRLTNKDFIACVCEFIHNESNSENERDDNGEGSL